MENYADLFKSLVLKRIGVKSEELRCPRENSSMTPCVARDGQLAVTLDVLGSEVCVGCICNVKKLLEDEQSKHKG